MATLTEKFGKRVRELRKKQGLTQEKLAEKAKIDYSYLNLIESGKKNLSLKRIGALARALEVKISELFNF